jgi:hypothetical protein
VRRCHFIKDVIGNIYAPGTFDSCLQERACTNATCGCHIGYVHLGRLSCTTRSARACLSAIPLGYR